VTLTLGERAFLHVARTATLATIDPAGLPRLVPICFVVDEGDGLRLLTPIDEKPKSIGDPRALARVRDIVARPEVSVLIDRWDEDWARLAWLRLTGRAVVVDPGTAPAGALDALRAKYPQYATHRLEGRPMIAIAIRAATSWGLDRDEGGPGAA
jgi:PPOX class probable F420-dependent enzyme